MKQPEFKVYLQFLYKHEILKAIQDYYESNSWTITDNNKIVNTLTGEKDNSHILNLSIIYNKKSEKNWF